jgi:hypothetical protein
MCCTCCFRLGRALCLCVEIRVGQGNADRNAQHETLALSAHVFTPLR